MTNKYFKTLAPVVVHKDPKPNSPFIEWIPEGKIININLDTKQACGRYPWYGYKDGYITLMDCKLLHETTSEQEISDWEDSPEQFATMDEYIAFSIKRIRDLKRDNKMFVSCINCILDVIKDTLKTLSEEE